MNLVIVSTNKDKYSETFIHNHVLRLSGNIHFLFDGYLPTKYSSDRGITSHCLFSFYHKNPFSFPLFGKKSVKEKTQIALKRYLIRNKIDGILCEYGPSGVELMYIAQSLGIPLIVHFHGYDAYRNDILSSYGKQYVELFNISTAIIVVSKHMHQQVIKLGCDKAKIHCLVYGIDLKIFDVTRNKSNIPIFVTSGRFVEKKAPQLTILAFQKILCKHPNAMLFMIGDGELLNECMLLVNQLGINNSVEFKGVLNQPQIAEIFAVATAFLQHSITTINQDAEGTPLAILEAMSSGLPVISTKHTGIADLISNGENGLLVNEQDIEGMAEKMLWVLENSYLSQQMGLKAKDFIHNFHSMNNYIEELLNLIQKSVSLQHSKKQFK